MDELERTREKERMLQNTVNRPLTILTCNNNLFLNV